MINKIQWRIGAFFVLIAAVFVLDAPSTPLAQAQLGSSRGEIEWLAACEFYDLFLVPSTEVADDTIECGLMYTTEDPTDPNSLEIEIAFAILYSVADESAPDPILYLEGGPGGSAIMGVDAWVASPLRQERDIILVDQRGTGYSWPSLNCYSYLDDEYDISLDPELCLDALAEEGVDVGNYNTVNNAADMALLMDLLIDENGYTNYNLLGISYGTRLGLAIMRDHPQLVRSAILDSVYPQGIDAYAEQLLNYTYALETLFAACNADAACNAAYPDLENVFFDVVADLDEFPIEEEDGYQYTGGDFIYDITDALSDTYFAPIVPAVIYLYAEGDYDTADEYLWDGIHLDDSDYFGPDYYDIYDADLVDEYFYFVDLFGDADAMFMALECQEEVYFSGYDDAVALAEQFDIDPVIADLELSNLESMEAECAYWTDTPASAVEDQPISSDIPTLVVAGEFDSITPPSWAQYAARTLPNSQYFVFPGFGHGVTDGAPCVIDIFDQFLANPLADVDASCITGMEIAFVIVE